MQVINNRPCTASFLKRPDVSSVKSLRKTKYVNLASDLTNFCCMKTISKLIQQKQKLTSIHNCSSSQNYKSSQSRLYVSQKKIVDKRDNFNSLSNKFYKSFKQNLIERNPNLKAKIRHSVLIQNKGKNKICQFISQNMPLKDQNTFLPYNYRQFAQEHLQKSFNKFNNQVFKQKQVQIKQHPLYQKKPLKKQKQNGFKDSFNYSQNIGTSKLNYSNMSNKNIFKSQNLYQSKSAKKRQKQQISTSIYSKISSALTQPAQLLRRNSPSSMQSYPVFIIDSWKDPQDLSLSKLMAE